MAAFDSGQVQWIQQLGDLRNVIRQELIRRQLAPLAKKGSSVLDVGAGQGTQAIELARLGCVVTCLEPSPQLRALCSASANEAKVRLTQIDATLADAVTACEGRQFDLVCAHGLLMYLDDRTAAIGQLADRVAPGGRLSIAFRNGDALAARPGMRRDWPAAIEAMRGDRYLNGVGVDARADRLADVETDLRNAGLVIEQWFGVRVFNDSVPHGSALPAGEDLQALLEVEALAAAKDPYRWFGSLLHVIAVKDPQR